MKKVLTGGSLAALILCTLLCALLCSLAGCGKSSSDEDGTKVSSYEIPTEYTYSFTEDGKTVNCTYSMEFEENQFTVFVSYESDGKYETGTLLFLLDEYGNVVREMSYGDAGVASYIYDYAYDPYGNRQMDCYHRKGSAPEALTTYLCRGETLYYTQYSSRNYNSYEGKMTYVYDENGRLVKRKTDYRTTTISYDEQGNFTEQVHEYDEGEVYKTTYENTYDGNRLTAITATEDGQRNRMTVGKYRSYKMTEGQYRCVRLLSLYMDAEIFRGTGAGSKEICYADGTPYKRVKEDRYGNPLTVTYYLPDGDEDYTRSYGYNGDGMMGSVTIRSSAGETTLVVYPNLAFSS